MDIDAEPLLQEDEVEVSKTRRRTSHQNYGNGSASLCSLDFYMKRQRLILIVLCVIVVAYIFAYLSLLRKQDLVLQIDSIINDSSSGETGITLSPQTEQEEQNLPTTTTPEANSHLETTPDTSITSEGKSSEDAEETEDDVTTTEEPNESESDEDTHSTSSEDVNVSNVEIPKNISSSVKATDSEGCKIPQLNPKDPSIKKIIEKKVDPPECKKHYGLVFDVEIGPNNSSLVEVHDSKDIGWVDCCYKLVHRGKKASDDSERISKKCYTIIQGRTPIPPDHEFIAIYCNSTKNDTLRHKMIDAFALSPLKPNVENRSEEIYKKQNLRAEEQMNLVILGIDAVSHMNFQRIMPEVRKFLIDDLEGLWLDGYTKVGDNTFPNVLAMLSAQTVNESKADCSKKKSFDNCPMIWKQYSKHGYRTAYGEDSPWMGGFNYLMNGFKHQPTDYYLRPITRVAEENIKADHRGNAHICYGPRLSLEFLLINMKSLATTMGKDKRYFQFTWATSLTHDYVNEGRLGETPVLNFLHWMKDNGHFENTVFVLLSDHGLRWGPIRQTHQGKLEENLPFLYAVFPPRFRKKYSEAITNFINNRNRLTTPFDVHETMLDILYPKNLEKEMLERREELIEQSELNNTLPRGISLFLPISKSRTCEVAEVEEHWCVCHTRQPFSVSNGEVQQAANYALFAINSLISHQPKCAYLGLSSVNNAYQVRPANEKKFGVKGQTVFELSFFTTPGNGSFDATVIKNKKDEWHVSGSISRTNKYGQQGDCMEVKDLQKYCYCLS